MATDSDVLYAAAEYIHTHGWCQGMIENQQGAVCATGALLKTIHPNATGGLADAGIKAQWSRVQGLLTTSLGIGSGVSQWNDVPGRTAAEVYRALVKCADEQEEK